MNDQTWITLAGIGALFAFAVWIVLGEHASVGGGSLDLEARVKQLEKWMADLHPEAQKKQLEEMQKAAESGSDTGVSP